MFLSNVLVSLFFSVTFRSDFCFQHPQFSSGSLSVSAVDSRAAVQCYRERGTTSDPSLL